MITGRALTLSPTNAALENSVRSEGQIFVALSLLGSTWKGILISLTLQGGEEPPIGNKASSLEIVQLIKAASDDLGWIGTG